MTYVGKAEKENKILGIIIELTNFLKKIPTFPVARMTGQKDLYQNPEAGSRGGMTEAFQG